MRTLDCLTIPSILRFKKYLQNFHSLFCSQLPFRQGNGYKGTPNITDVAIQQYAELQHLEQILRKGTYK